MTICVDANIVIRYVVEPGDSARQSLMRSWLDSGVKLIAPTLLRYEVTNALRGYVRAGLRTSPAVDMVLRAALALPIDLVSDDALHFAALEMAERVGIGSAYDAQYLALAERMGAEFWTSDRKLVSALGGRFSWVRLSAISD